MEGASRQPQKITRLRSGCRTCRIRRVKCDETPGECLRCKSTGRKCDRYDLNRLPFRRKLTSELNRYRPQLNWAGKTSDERRCLSYFQFLTVPTMNRWFDHSLWDKLIPQMTEAEPAVCHAVVALSTLQEAIELAGGEVLLEDMTNRHQLFAVEQYNRSISNMNSRIGSNDPAVKNTVLVCCILYVFYELLRGKYDRAFYHLRKGVEIIEYYQSAAPHPSLDGRIEDTVAAALTHLDLQGSHFGVSQLRDVLELSKLEAWQEEGNDTLDSQLHFRTLSEAWSIRNRLFHDFCVYYGFCEKLTATQFADNFSILSAKTKKHQMQLVMFVQALDRLEAIARLRKIITKKEQRAIDLLRMHSASLSIMIETTLIRSTQFIRENYRERFIKVVDLAEHIVSNILEDNGEQSYYCTASRATNPRNLRPQLMMEIGIFAPLYFMSEKCGDMAIIQRAMRVIQAWPHREGLWDSQLALTLFHGMVDELKPVLDNDKIQ